MSDRTQVIGDPYRDRDNAREMQLQLQGFLDGLWEAGGPYEGAREIAYAGFHMPSWTRGVRVDSAQNGNQHILIATEHRGH